MSASRSRSIDSSSCDEEDSVFKFDLEDRGTHYVLRFEVASAYVKEVCNSLRIFPRLPPHSRLRIVGCNKQIKARLKTRYSHQKVDVFF